MAITSTQMAPGSNAVAPKEPSALPRYVLVTPARNEAAQIGQTLESVSRQTAPPLKWVIVDDASTDGTGEIARRYAARFPWIEVAQMPPRQGRDFAAKVRAFDAGLERVRALDYQVIGNLDADVSLAPGDLAALVSRFAADPKLGVAGPAFSEGGRQLYDYRYTSAAGVWGGCQLFRRDCFEQIGGYVPIAGGGIDYAAVLKARAAGWKTRTFEEVRVIHHRRMGTAESRRLQARYRMGKKDYALGCHPLWEAFRVGYQMTKPPLALGGLAIGAGYLASALRRAERPISPELVAFRRREEMARLRAKLGLAPRPAGAGRS
jgi:biofilm PGA synthesis N-glycosyltransferase PgaC